MIWACATQQENTAAKQLSISIQELKDSVSTPKNNESITSRRMLALLALTLKMSRTGKFGERQLKQKTPYPYGTDARKKIK